MDIERIGAGVLLLVLLAGLVAMFVFWLSMTLHAMKRDLWGWFFAQLFFGFLASLIYRMTAWEPPARGVRRGRRAEVGRERPRRGRGGEPRRGRRGAPRSGRRRGR